LSAPRSFLASTSSTNKIFFGGGDGYTSYAPTVDIFDINTLQSPSSLQIPSFSTGTISPSNLPIAIVSVLSSSQPLSSNGLPAGATVGIVVGVVLMLIGLGVIILNVIFKRKLKQKTEIQTSHATNIERHSALTKISKLQSLVSHSQISFNELVIEKEVAEGSYGRVCLGRWDGASVALKFCRKKANVEDFVSEIKIMVELPPHPNVVQLYGVSLDGPQPVIIMEYCAGGSLDKLLFDTNKKLSIEYKIELIRNVAAGLHHLHKHNIVHRDLAARNILLTGSGEPKISDFGMSRILEEKEGKTQSNIGPIRWMAPESIGQHKYSKQSDVWTFGIVVWEIVMQREPHTEVDPVDVGRLIRDNFLTPKIPDDCPLLLRQLMEMCWQKDSEQRPNMDQVCQLLNR
jgi:predicted Ser/Thr protein kinase